MLRACTCFVFAAKGGVCDRKLAQNCSRTTEASGARQRLLRHALVSFVANSLCRGQGKHTMLHEQEVQIGNPGLGP